MLLNLEQLYLSLKEEIKMLCDNCGKKEANVHYLRNINGIKKEMNLCEECSEKLGINHMCMW